MSAAEREILLDKLFAARLGLLDLYVATQVHLSESLKSGFFELARARQTSTGHRIDPANFDHRMKALLYLETDDALHMAAPDRLDALLQGEDLLASSHRPASVMVLRTFNPGDPVPQTEAHPATVADDAAAAAAAATTAASPAAVASGPAAPLSKTEAHATTAPPGVTSLASDIHAALDRSSAILEQVTKALADSSFAETEAEAAEKRQPPAVRKSMRTSASGSSITRNALSDLRSRVASELVNQRPSSSEQDAPAEGDGDDADGDGHAGDMSSDEEPPEPTLRNPANWFGALVPPALRQSQKHFRSAVGHIELLANISIEMASIDALEHQLKTADSE
ncbi:hypothetical protein H696_02322 [Fonticula alba]|uniref:Vacuolar ATPase assembly protein VMA22 n=1 Tax=Fonticula alba TaxID=691883 RepID=A0A058ZAI2_FONAL|nr:hypothetical protein H696_02322 [Fonticula alba]KCV71370.1 hypothetical protein H696_02322 [Fonticula alba]|eukprot:XP_009494493.1 hypothetical protein H696_02322 [Fonticula alba]